MIEIELRENMPRNTGDDRIVAGTGAGIVHGSDDLILGEGSQSLYADCTPLERHGNVILVGGDGDGALDGDEGKDQLAGAGIRTRPFTSHAALGVSPRLNAMIPEMTFRFSARAHTARRVAVSTGARA